MQITYTWASIKKVQAKGKAFSSPQHHFKAWNFLTLSFLWVTFVLLDPDPHLTKITPKSGSETLIYLLNHRKISLHTVFSLCTKLQKPSSISTHLKTKVKNRNFIVILSLEGKNLMPLSLLAWLRYHKELDIIPVGTSIPGRLLLAEMLMESGLFRFM